VDEEELKGAKKALRDTVAKMKGVNRARNLVNQPANSMSPKQLVQEAKQIARRYGDVKIQIWDKQKIKKERMRAFLAVAEGSKESPYVIKLSYKPKRSRKKVAIVGKGITFDSGGLSIKPADHMHTMKIDMAGAATVLGLFEILGQVGCQVEVKGYIAACENMPSGSAYRPGDIVASRNGKTIEIKNTDAEGRVTLADMLDVAVSEKPDVLVDVATLTGACMVALGESVAGLMGNDQDLMDAIKRAAKETGEQVA
jgi:leucyl aminopeptidase